MSKDLAYKTLVDSILNKAAPFIGAYLTNFGFICRSECSPYLEVIKDTLYLADDENVCIHILSLIERVTSEVEAGTGIGAAFGAWLIHLPITVLRAKLECEHECAFLDLETTLDVFNNIYLQTV